MTEKFNGAVSATGVSLISQAVSANTKLQFISVLGSTSKYTDDQLPTLTDDILASASRNQTGHISNVAINDDDTVNLEIVLDGNSVTADYTLNTVLILARVGSTDHLFAILKANQGQYMNAYDGKSSTNLEIKVGFKVSNTDVVSLTVDSAGTLTRADYEELKDYTDEQVAGGTVVHTNADEKISGVKTFIAKIMGRITNADSADQATKLTTAQTINGVAFDGTKPIIIKATPSNDADIGHLSQDQSWAGNNSFAKQILGTISEAIHAATASASNKLVTSRKIGGVPFDGTADINLPGVNAAGNQNTTGNAATADKATEANHASKADAAGTATTAGATTGNSGSATKLLNARTINGVGFDGTGNIIVPEVATRLLTAAEDWDDINTSGVYGVNGLTLTSATNHTPMDSKFWGYLKVFAGSTTVNQYYYDGVNDIKIYARTYAGSPADWTVWKKAMYAGDTASLATKLANARTINGVPFDGSGNISITDPGAVRTTGNQSIDGSKTFTNQLYLAKGIGGSLELYPYAGQPTYIDFHFGGSTADYTTRLVETGTGAVTINGPAGAAATLSVANLSGNASSSTKLAAARGIGSAKFDGTGDISSDAILGNTGWIDATPLLNKQLKAFDGGGFKYRKIGNMIYFAGAVTPVSPLPGATEKTMMFTSFPYSMVPDMSNLQPGSYGAYWVFGTDSGGDFYVSRYMEPQGSEPVKIPTGDWLAAGGASFVIA